MLVLDLDLVRSEIWVCAGIAVTSTSATAAVA